MIDQMSSLIGGRVAEEIVNGQPSTGALNDLERLTKTAYAMVVYYGMSDKVGTVSYFDSTGSRGYELSKPYSEKTAELIDAEVKALVERIHDRTKEILLANREKFTELAELLLEKEVIFADDMERIFGPRKAQESVFDDNGHDAGTTSEKGEAPSAGTDAGTDAVTDEGTDEGTDE